MRNKKHNYGDIYIKDLQTSEIITCKSLNEAGKTLKVTHPVIKFKVLQGTIYKERYVITCQNPLSENDKISYLKKKAKYSNQSTSLKCKNDEAYRKHQTMRRKINLHKEKLRNPEKFKSIEYKVRLSANRILSRNKISVLVHPDLSNALRNLKKLELQCQN